MKLNPYSHELWKHIKKAPNFKNHKRFSKTTKQFISKILRQIKEGESQFQRLSNMHPLREPDPTSYKSNRLYNSIPPQIKTIIETTDLLQVSYEFSINMRKIHIHIISPTHREPKDIQSALKLIYTWFYVASQYASNPKCASSLQLYIYLIPHRKVLPNTPNTPIDAIHANTAFTWACVENSTIQIFREEEWFKVLIHETFHTLGLDFSTMNIAKCQQKIAEWFSIQTEGLLFESYCETWATLINSIFLGRLAMCLQSHSATLTPHTPIRRTRKSRPPNSARMDIENLILLETKYSMFQSIKVLKHYGLSYGDIVYKTAESAKQRELYKEKTNVFCYNVLKAMMLYHINDFIAWCNGDLEFQKTPQHIENFCKWIEERYKTHEYIEDYGAIQKWADGSQKHANSKYIFDSMRMTIFG